MLIYEHSLISHIFCSHSEHPLNFFSIQIFISNPVWFLIQAPQTPSSIIHKSFRSKIEKISVPFSSVFCRLASLTISSPSFIFPWGSFGARTLFGQCVCLVVENRENRAISSWSRAQTRLLVSLALLKGAHGHLRPPDSGSLEIRDEMQYAHTQKNLCINNCFLLKNQWVEVGRNEKVFIERSQLN